MSTEKKPLAPAAGSQTVSGIFEKAQAPKGKPVYLPSANRQRTVGQSQAEARRESARRPKF